MSDVPVVPLLLYGMVGIYRQSPAGMILGIVFGGGGLLPFPVPRLSARAERHLDRVSSHTIIYTSLVTGVALRALSIRGLS